MATYKAGGAYTPGGADSAGDLNNTAPGETNGDKKNGNSPKKKRRNLVLNILLIVAILVFAFSLYQIIKINSDYKVGSDEYATLEADYIAYPDPDAEDPNNPGGYLRVNYDGLESTNSDFVCWIEVPNTVISYPVVWYTDNDYYLRRTFNKQSATSGVIFVDARSQGDFSGQNTVVHGHRMNDGTMFAALAKFMDQSYYADHNEIRVYTEDGIRIYEVFSCFQLDVHDEDRYYRFSFDSADDYGDWVADMKSCSNYDTGVYVDSSSQVITLSTCVYGNDDLRYVVMGVYRETVPNPQ